MSALASLTILDLELSVLTCQIVWGVESSGKLEIELEPQQASQLVGRDPYSDILFVFNKAFLKIRA